MLLTISVLSLTGLLDVGCLGNRLSVLLEFSMTYSGLEYPERPSLEALLTEVESA